MEAAQQMVVKNFSLRVLKEPRGFIKFIEFIIAIFAFATTAGHCDWFSFSINCNPPNDATTRVDYCYPFDMNQIVIKEPLCQNSTDPVGPGTSLRVDPSSSAEYFVAVGVLAFLYCIVILLWYVFFEHNHRDKDLPPFIDFLITCIFVLLWLTASAAWAKGVTDVKWATDFGQVSSWLTECEDYTCSVEKKASHATLNVSVVFGFLNMFVWGGNVWFVYKETTWFNKYSPSKEAPPAAADQETAASPVPSPAQL
ncbi:synaptophysin-like [Glandiceps talaboti]